MSYDDGCTHGGPPIEAVEHALEALEVFQTRVLERKLFDLPPGLTRRGDARNAHLDEVCKWLRTPEFDKLLSLDIGRVFLSEAVDCSERGEAIAHAWVASAFVISFMTFGGWSVGHEAPAALRAVVAEADEDLAGVLWRWTPCNCVAAPGDRLPWSDEKAKAAQQVKTKNWSGAMAGYQQVLKTLVEEEGVEKELVKMCGYSGRGWRGVQRIHWERARTYSNLALCKLSLGDAEAALEAGRLAAEADPSFAKAYGRQVLALEALGRPASDAAEAALRVAKQAGEEASEYEKMVARHAGGKAVDGQT
eukprot:TRINITY_DN20224_c1_g1_i1.p1 TRINITY_DN20224_c1_g1~~TRINITY_DN20224_c1_g1_i1.p1  ORF type:complete len:306 (+),score=89.86 TRINITY_DN20224_c1_g1_i1:35-952(+)